MIDSISTTIAATFCNGPTINPEPQQPQHTWVELTRNEILEAINDFYKSGASEREVAFARVIQAKLKEKNT